MLDAGSASEFGKQNNTSCTEISFYKKKSSNNAEDSKSQGGQISSTINVAENSKSVLQELLELEFIYIISSRTYIRLQSKYLAITRRLQQSAQKASCR